MNRQISLKLVICFIIISTTYSCKQQKNQKEESHDNISSTVNEFKDSIFILKNAENLDFVDKLNWDFENLYYDSSKNLKFEKLNNELKIKYLKDFLKNEDGSKIPIEWIKSDMQAFIIANRPVINDFQPIIIKVYGTDYTAILLVNINKSGKVISGFPIYSLENSGPLINEDTLIVSRPKTMCKFVNNTIFTSKLTGICNPKKRRYSNFFCKSDKL